MNYTNPERVDNRLLEATHNIAELPTDPSQLRAQFNGADEADHALVARVDSSDSIQVRQLNKVSEGLLASGLVMDLVMIEPPVMHAVLRVRPSDYVPG